VARIVAATDGSRAEAVGRILDGAGERGVIARGLGRSYGDAAQNAGGDVAAMTGLDRIIDINPVAATATVEAGVSLGALMEAVVPLGLWPTVSPGTRHVTIGGAIASDIHGKGHHRDGTFGTHVRSMAMVAPGLGPVTLTPEAQPEEFWATTGGMGLTGIVHRATMNLLRIETAAIKVETYRTDHLEQTMSLLAERDQRHRYSVAWIDCLATGGSLGRSVVDFGDHATRADLNRESGRPRGISAEHPLRYDLPATIPTPPWAPSALLNRLTVAAFNQAWYRKSPRSAEGYLVSLPTFFHPLDRVKGWNRLYGRRGFLQYQCVLPDGEEATLSRIIEQLAESRAASFLAVLKRFGPANPGPLSFPRPGWTLALDLPATGPGLASRLDGLDEMVAVAGGRVYLAKDSRLRPDLLEAMYPQLPAWRQVRARMDPRGVMQSDLSRRLPALI
jgi:decaprenylphospho-beta-D-ribofuranose 2-oxidase